MKYIYDAKRGAEYARLYAEYFKLDDRKRLFFYDSNGSDCSNFCSQCVWAAYGGWVSGMDQNTIAENKDRIRKHVRMAPFVWYGSLSFSGSNRWCRVIEFYDYAVSGKANGPMATGVFEGEWQRLDPSVIRQGDVIQLLVKSYAPYRYGHCLYVTEAGKTPDEIRICCHSYDRRDAPLSEFSSFPEEYTRLRILRFKDSVFVK